MAFHSNSGDTTYEQEVERLEQQELKKKQRREKYKKIKDLKDQGFPYEKLAIMFNLSSDRIQKIVNQQHKQLNN